MHGLDPTGGANPVHATANDARRSRGRAPGIAFEYQGPSSFEAAAAFVKIATTTPPGPCRSVSTGVGARPGLWLQRRFVHPPDADCLLHLDRRHDHTQHQPAGSESGRRRRAQRRAPYTLTKRAARFRTTCRFATPRASVRCTWTSSRRPFLHASVASTTVSSTCTSWRTATLPERVFCSRSPLSRVFGFD